MTKKKRSKLKLSLKVILWLVLITALLAIGVVRFWQYLPYNNTAARQISHTLESYGLKVESLVVERLSKFEAVLNTVQLGKEPGFKVGKITATYTLQELQDLKVREVEAEQIQTHVYMKDGTLVISGLEPFMITDAPKADSEKPSILFDASEIQKILPEVLHAKDIVLTGNIAGSTFETQLNADLIAEPSLELHLASPRVNLQSGEYQLALDDVDVKASFNSEKKQWNMKLASPNVSISGVEPAIPDLKITADGALTADTLITNIQAHDATKKYLASAAVTLPLNNPKTGKISVNQLAFPWGGGIISLKPVAIPLTFNKPISLAIELKKVKLAELLATLGEGKISGTGEISGVLPITYYPNGRVTLQKGNAEALEAGLITVSPSLLPGDSEQIQVARTTLENFHYTTLRISVSSDKEEKSTIHLTLEGNNPDAFDGRPVKLNVNIAGDILPLIQQSVLPINNLKQLLELQDKP